MSQERKAFRTKEGAYLLALNTGESADIWSQISYNRQYLGWVSLVPILKTADTEDSVFD